MRRDPCDHPNGLLDFALCSTIEHLKSGGYEGLSLNFATMRSTLSGDRGDGTVQRAERWFLKRLSSFAQIESLWRFNAKYEPEWLPRYVVFDTAEHLVPVLMAIIRAESMWEIPVLGKLLAAGAEKRTLAAQQDAEEFIVSSFGSLNDGDYELRSEAVDRDGVTDLPSAVTDLTDLTDLAPTDSGPAGPADPADPAGPAGPAGPADPSPVTTGRPTGGV